MSVTLEKVIEEARELSPQDRQELLARLTRDLETEEAGSPAEIDAAWDMEIFRRLEEIDSGKVKLVPAEEVFSKIQTRMDEAG